MKPIFVKKAYDDIQLLFVNIIIHVAPDIFAFRIFNHLAYNQKISNPLVASYLFELPDHYILSDNVKFINLASFWKYF